MRFDAITLITDMDGTLLKNDKTISKKNLEAIEYFRLNGGNFSIASGRIYEKVSLYAETLKLDKPFISHNGCVIYDYNEKKVLFTKILDEKYAKTAYEIIKLFPDVGAEAAGIQNIYFVKDNAYIQQHIKDEKFQNVMWYNFENIDCEITKILFAGDPLIMDKMEKAIPKIFPDYTFCRSDLIYFEMMPKGVSKGSALSKLTQYISDRKTTVYAIGDNMNDYEMLKAADVGIAMKNAHYGLKMAADFILPYNNEQDAIAQLIFAIETGKI